jgi:hypothetical protein
MAMKSHVARAFAAVLSLALAACGKTVHWEEEVSLLSQQSIIVSRTVELNFTGGELSNATTRWPTTYTLTALNPLNGKKYVWKGSYGLNPILLEFSKSSAFLIAIPMRCDAKIEKYSLNGFPYIFMKNEDGKNWLTVAPDKFPTEYLTPNLSASYDGFWVERSNLLSAERISGINRTLENSTSKFLQIPIPRAPQEWQYKYKSEKGYTGC